MNLELPKCHTNYYKNSFAFSGAKLWNDLPPSVKMKVPLKGLCVNWTPTLPAPARPQGNFIFYLYRSMYVVIN